MKQKSWHLNRREMLRASGIAIALPFLDSMAWGKSAENKAMPKRMVVSYFAYGMYTPKDVNGKHNDWNWFPCKEAGDLTFNKSSSPFKSLKNEISYCRGLDHAHALKLPGHSGGDVFATGADMIQNEKTNNISVDQVAAKHMGHHTRFGSLVLGTEGGTGAYSASKTLSHYGPGRPIPSLDKPQDIFNRLFNPYSGKTLQEVRAGLKREASNLDLVMDETKSLMSRLGKEDKNKMNEYLESLRALEKRIERTSQWTHEALPKVDTKGLSLEAKKDNPQEYTRCMYDLLFLALQTDSTRFASFMLESEQSQTSLMWNYATLALGYKGATHDLAHKHPIDHGHWDQWRAKQHAYFLQRLKNAKEGDGNMLDNTIVLWGSSHPMASHSNTDYPIHLAGGKNLGFKHGKLHDFRGKKKVPLANLFVSMLNAVDAPVKSFADSTGDMKELRS